VTSDGGIMFELACQHRLQDLGGGPLSIRSLRVSVIADGERITYQEPILDSPLPYETEIEFYTRRAVGTLHAILKDRRAAAVT
jgi:hypothetical protein